MARKRSLSPAEQALWDQIARTATPLHPKRPAAENKPAPKPPKPARAKPEPSALPGPLPTTLRIEGKGARRNGHDLQAPLTQRMKEAPVHMDRKTHAKMKRGKIVPEARLDLHGMTVSQAHIALLNFVVNGHARGLRLILVITGKGKDRDEAGPIPTRYGVLRHQVPQWLRMVPLAPLVLQVTTAAQRHGGHGAYYVYLRRRR